MSIYKVDTESIIALSRLLHVGANAVDQTMRQSAAPALRKIVFQRGADVFATAQRLADALRRMNTLKNDLNIMGDALKVVAEEAYNSDGSVFALFQGIPVCVATNQQIVQFDYTAMFLDNRNPKVDALLIGWASNWIENMKGVVANGLNKLGVKVALWDTIPEEMIRDSIDSLLEQLEKDSIEGGYDNSKFDEAYGMYRKFLSLGIEIEDTSIQELMGRSTDEFTENEYLQLLVKKENLSFMKEISDQLDAGFAEYDALKHTIGLADEIKQELARNYIARTKNLLAIKQALLDTGYDNETVNRTIDEMLREYQDSYLRAIKMTLSKVADKGIDKAMGKAGLLKLFLYTVDESNRLLGTTKTVNHLKSVYATASYSYALVEKFNQYAQIIRSGKYTQADIDQCNQYFELARQAKIQEYQAIVDFTNEQLSSISIATAQKKADARQMIQEIEAEIDIGQSAEAAEQQRRQRNAGGLPLTKDHDRQRKEAEAGHAGFKTPLADAGQNVADAAQTAQHTGDQHAGPAHLIYVDAHGVRCLRMLTTGHQPQAEAGLVQQHIGRHKDHHGNDHEPVKLKITPAGNKGFFLLHILDGGGHRGRGGGGGGP